MTRTRFYRDGVLEKENFPVEDVSDLIQHDGATVWVDFTSPTADDLQMIEEELGLHRLAVENAITGAQRPKLDRYESHWFLAAYGVHLDASTGELSTSEVRAFITAKVLVTVHEPDFRLDELVAHWDREPGLAAHGVSFLVWGLLDHIVDGHFEAVQSFDEEIDNLEDALFDDRPRDIEVQRRSFELRKSLLLLRRVVLPMREVVNSFLRPDSNFFDQGMVPYLHDVYDHALRAAEWTDSLRDLVTTILEANIGLRGNRMNLIMKKVTSWAAIIAVPTAVTGFYGQNLPYPGSGTEWGFWFSSGLIVAVSVTLYITFRVRDWL